MAGDYGLSRDGFKRKRLPEIKKDLADRISDKLGVRIQDGSNSLFGQLIGVFAYDIADLWEQAEQVYNAMYPSTATGASLSNAAGLAGIAQIDAEQTTLYATCYGTEGTFIPFGAKISDGDGVTYSCVETSANITASRANSIQLTVSSVATGTTYSVAIDGTSSTYTAFDDDTKIIVLSKLAEGFSFTDRDISVANEVMTVSMADKNGYMSVTNSNLTVKKLGTPVKFRCDNYGAIEPAIGFVANIVSALAGWDSVKNEADATVGRDTETDIALRQRWSSSVYSRGSAMVESIASHIYKDVSGVQFVKVYENNTDSTDSEGRPPHSIEAVVSGGEDREIAAQIWRNKAAGIDTYGSVSKDIDDSQGVTHTIHFNRPTKAKVWIKVVLGRNTEEEFPQSGLKDIKEAILKKASELTVGEDVVLQRFYASVFNATTGVGYISITACVGETAGEYKAENVVIGPRQVAVFDASRIGVTME